MSIAALFALLRLATLPALELLDMKVLDLRHRLRGPLPTSDAVVIVAIDEVSLTEVGRWPWPRSRLAAMVERLTAAGARAIGFDMVLDQSDPSVDLEALRRAAAAEPHKSAAELLTGLRTQFDNDERLAAALRASGRVILGHFFAFGLAAAGTGTGDPATISEITARVTPDAHADAIPEATTFHGNISMFADAAAGVGHLNFFPDADGAYRRAPLVIRIGERFAPALSLEAVRRFAGGVAATMTVERQGVAGLRLGTGAIPVDEEGELWINYLGPAGTFPYLRAADVIAGRVPEGAVDGKIALVAATAVGFDALASPFSSVLPGVEVHATVIDNMLQDQSLRRPSWVVPLEAAIVLGLGVVVGVVLRIAGAWGAGAAVALLLTYTWGTQYLFTTRGLVLSAIYPLGAITFATLGGTVLRYVTEEREKQKVRDAFRHYLNPEVTELLAREPERLRLGGERREVTIFFSDIRGFTTVSEALAPEALSELLNEYLGAMTDILFAHEGLLDKYIGDAVMAIWGAPIAVPDHAARACRAALDMLATLGRLNEQWVARGWPRLDIGVGIDTGDVVVGNFGSAQRFNYTAMGDHVNLASRLEGLNKVYGTRVLVTEATRCAIGAEFICREIDRVRVKGKYEAVTIYEVLGRLVDDEDGRQHHLADVFNAALAAYRSRSWDEAIGRLGRVAAQFPSDKPTALYLERTRALRASPPDESWDGVFVAKEK